MPESAIDLPDLSGDMFPPGRTHDLLELLRAQPVGALGTLHKAQPFVSMVPFALLPAAGRFVIHVSRLATHTRDMLDSSAVSLMVAGTLKPGLSARELPRATFQCQAQPCAPNDPMHEAARAAYLTRFPESVELFGFADFSLFTLEPRHVRHVGGFGQAGTVMQPELATILARAIDPVLSDEALPKSPRPTRKTPGKPRRRSTGPT